MSSEDYFRMSSWDLILVTDKPTLKPGTLMSSDMAMGAMVYSCKKLLSVLFEFAYD